MNPAQGGTHFGVTPTCTLIEGTQHAQPLCPPRCPSIGFVLGAHEPDRTTLDQQLTFLFIAGLLSLLSLPPSPQYSGRKEGRYIRSLVLKSRLLIITAVLKLIQMFQPLHFY